MRRSLWNCLGPKLCLGPQVRKLCFPEAKQSFDTGVPKQSLGTSIVPPRLCPSPIDATTLEDMPTPSPALAAEIGSRLALARSAGL
ncbi:MAG: hypothetical protein L0211_05215, partial [Planctomycetaceae bacterium]|nr:hypothetical protein [Planctomycetaceae bacterium]